MIANLWRWAHDFDRRVTALFRGGELCAVIPHEVGIAGPSVEERAQFIVDACNEKEQREADEEAAVAAWERNPWRKVFERQLDESRTGTVWNIPKLGSLKVDE